MEYTEEQLKKATEETLDDIAGCCDNLEMGIKQMVYVQIVAEQLSTASVFVAVAIVLLSVKHVVRHLVMGVAKLDRI